MVVPLEVLYPAMKLPVPIFLWWHCGTQKRRAKRVGKLQDPNAPVLLPIYTTVIIIYLLYVIAMVLNRILDLNALTKKSWEQIHASCFLHGLLYYVLGEGTLIFALFFVFSFLAAPTAGKYALQNSIYDACKFCGVYGVIFMAAVCSKIEREVYFQLKAVGALIVVYFFFTLLLQIVRLHSLRWKRSLYYTVFSVLVSWIIFFILLLFAVISPRQPHYAKILTHAMLAFYDFLLPLLVYKCLIDDSRFWRNLEKHLIPSKSFALDANLLENDGLRPITSGNFGDLNDTFVNLNIPLIDFAQLESSHSILGIGGNGVVWKGTFEGEPVAVKQAKTEKISVNMVKEFLREALLSTKFEHPNILKFHGVCVAPPEFLMVFEWCNENELGQYLETRERLSPMKRLDIALQSVIGLKFFHEKGLIHRDIKPQNYLVHEENGKTTVKLADFGSSRSQYDAMPLLRGISPIFAPPEIVKHLPIPETDPIIIEDQIVKCGPEVDIYSCGWVLWAILYKGNWRQKLKTHYRDMIDGWKPCVQTYDPQVQAILLQCWNDKPCGRPTISFLHASLQALTPAQTKGGDASFSARSLSSAFEIESLV